MNSVKNIFKDPVFGVLLVICTVSGLFANHDFHIPFVSEHTIGDCELMYIPTSYRWQRPVGDFPACVSVRVDGTNILNSLKETVHGNLPIVSIVISPKDFVGFNNGIYVIGSSILNPELYGRSNYSLNVPWWEQPGNYHYRGAEWQREIQIALFGPNGNTIFETTAGLRINGNATRAFPLKSLRIYSDDFLIEGKVFDDQTVNKFNRLILRNSGNDWDRTLFRDGLMQYLAPTTVAIQGFKQTVVYINGEYWGIHNIRERIDEHSIADKYNVAESVVSILELNGEIKCGAIEAQQQYKAMVQFIANNDLAIEENFNHVCSQFNIASLVDYMCCEIFFCNTDWPKNNVLFWRAEDDSTYGKWQWVLNDLDYGFGFTGDNAAQTNMFTHISNSGVDLSKIFIGLCSNANFRKLFSERMNELMNTRFSVDNINAAITTYSGNIQNEMNNHIRRWRTHISMEDWQNEVEVLRSFAIERRVAVEQNLNVFLSQFE